MDTTSNSNNYNFNLEEQYKMKDEKVIIMKKEPSSKSPHSSSIVDDHMDHMDDIDKKKVVVATNVGGSSSGVKKGLSAGGASSGGSGGCGGGGSSTKCCQAEKCSADLTDAKQYHKRHKVCEHHAKAQVVIVGGIRQRFCQQCSRFHEVSEFDEAKRSCRRRLAGHNERRRKSSGDHQTQAAEGSISGRKGGNSSAGTQIKDINNVCGDDHIHRAAGRLQINIQENSTNYKHFNIR